MKVSLRKKKLSNGTDSLYLDIYHKGKRRYEFLNLRLGKNKEQNKETKLLAEKIRANREVELQNNTYGFIPDFKRRISLFDYFEKYIEDKPKNSNYHSTLKKLKEFTKNDINFDQIDEKFLEDFKKFLLKSNNKYYKDTTVKQNTASIYFQNFKRVLRQAKQDKIITINPADNVRHIKMKDSKREFLSIDELQILAKTDCQNPEVKRAFLFACFTGLRFSDIKNLTWGAVNKDHLEIKQQKTEDYIYIPLSSTAKELLYQNQNNIHHMPELKVFDLPNRWFYNELLKRWFTRAEINKNASSHIARHTFATLNITQGAHLFTVSKLLGHKNLKTTEIYSKLIDDKKKEAVNNLPQLKI